MWRPDVGPVRCHGIVGHVQQLRHFFIGFALGQTRSTNADESESLTAAAPATANTAEASMRVNVPSLVTAYYAEVPNPSVPEQRVAFGTSGHRGSQGLRISTRSMRRASTERIICAASWRKHR